MSAKYRRRENIGSAASANGAGISGENVSSKMALARNQPRGGMLSRCASSRANSARTRENIAGMAASKRASRIAWRIGIACASKSYRARASARHARAASARALAAASASRISRAARRAAWRARGGAIGGKRRQARQSKMENAAWATASIGKSSTASSALAATKAAASIGIGKSGMAAAAAARQQSKASGGAAWQIDARASGIAYAAKAWRRGRRRIKNIGISAQTGAGAARRGSWRGGGIFCVTRRALRHAARARAIIANAHQIGIAGERRKQRLGGIKRRAWRRIAALIETSALIAQQQRRQRMAKNESGARRIA